MLASSLSAADTASRGQYYESYFRFGVGLDAEFVLGSKIQKSDEYITLLYTTLNEVSVGSLREVMPQSFKSQNQKQTLSIVYLLLQCLDAVVLDADLVFGVESQRKIYSLLQTLNEAVRTSGFDVPVEELYVNVPYDIKGNQLAESTSATRISIHDSIDTIRDKVRRMYAPPSLEGNADTRPNALLDMYQWSIFPWTDDPITFTRAQLLSPVEIDTFEMLSSLYYSGDIHPNDCKSLLPELLFARFEVIRNSMGSGVSHWINPNHA
jgi:tyrosyl-tRNA synthetase